MPNTTEIGKRLVELCNAGKNVQAVDELYSPTIVSIETHSMPNMPAQMEGIDAIKKKNQWWFENHEIQGQSHGGT